MAIYRESSPVWRRYLMFLGILVALIVTAGVVLLLMTTARPAAPATGSAATRQKLDDITTWLEQFDIEYRKIQPGTDKAETGAPGAIQQALNDYSTIEPDLQKLDAEQATLLKQELDLLKGKLDEPPVDANQVSSTVLEATTRILSLSQRLLETPTATP